MSIDREIIEAFQLVSVILVFVFAYSSAFWPQVREAIDQKAPQAEDDKQRLRQHRKRMRRSLIALSIFTTLLIGILIPLTFRVFENWSWGGHFNTARASLLLVDACLISVLFVIGGLVRELNAKIGK